MFHRELMDTLNIVRKVGYLGADVDYAYFQGDCLHCGELVYITNLATIQRGLRAGYCFNGKYTIHERCFNLLLHWKPPEFEEE